MTSEIRCVVFDVDDTLYLERDYVQSGLRSVDAWLRDRFGAQGFFERATEAFESGARRTLFDKVLPELGIEPTAELIESMVGVYRRHEPPIELLPDARLCLERLFGRCFLGAVTDGALESQRAKVRALRVDEFVDRTILTAELGEGFAKPHPRAFELIERASGHRAAACIYVADNPAKDFAAPHSLGWTTVRIRRQGGLHHDVESGEDVQRQVNDLSRLADELGLT